MKTEDSPPSRDELVKEVCRRIRVARSQWDAHANAACRVSRQRALELYEGLSKEERAKIPQVLRVWLRYRSEKYFGETRSPPRKE
jgi:DNA-binding MarR family transcriptional regulator